MPRLKADALAGSVKRLLAEKEAVTARQKALARTLNAVLNKIGYQVVPVAPGEAPARGARRRRRRGAGRRAARSVGKPARTRAKRRGKRRKRA